VRGAYLLRRELAMEYENEEAMVVALNRIASRMENIEYALLVPLEKMNETLSSIMFTLSDIDKSVRDLQG
jgi:hypothetical protein